MSLILSIIMTISFGGCSNTNIFNNNTSNATSSSSSNDDNLDTEEETTKEEVEITTETLFYPISKNLYTTNYVNLRCDSNTESEIIKVLDNYTRLELLGTNEEWHYVSDGIDEGYVSSKYTKELGNTFVEVDITDQDLYLYIDDELVLTADVVTGKKGLYDTRIGCNPIYAKQTDRYLKGDGYNVWVEYWMPFDKGIGLHDASWRNNFSNDAYLNGSHGCVNMKYDDAKYVYDNVEIGTNVLVHK